MEQVAHQTIVMQFVLELAKQTDVDPRSCVRPFFSRFDTSIAVHVVDNSGGASASAGI